jgi:hypothetical protein
MLRALATLAACSVLGACGSAATRPAAPVAVSIGIGPQFQPGPGAHATPGLRCSRGPAARFGVHLELFAAGHIVVVPAGIGVAPPLRRDGAYVRDGRCSFALRTREPTGVIEIASGTRASLGKLFDIWGRRLDGHQLLGFRGPVRAWVDGRPFAGDVRAIPLRRHAEIVLVSGPDVPVHAAFRFAAGL